jgi:hypothetical protein
MTRLFIAACWTACTVFQTVADPFCRGEKCPSNVVPIGEVIRRDCCVPPPPGWGWYRRQKYRADRAPPLVIVDELDAVTYVRAR